MKEGMALILTILAILTVETHYVFAIFVILIACGIMYSDEIKIFISNRRLK